MDKDGENLSDLFDQIKEAMHTYTSASDHNDPASQYKLAHMYMRGDIFPRDYVEGIKWLRKSADQEFPPAQAFLGRMYEAGLGVPQDKQKAQILFQKAIENHQSHSPQKKLKELWEHIKDIVQMLPHI